MTVPHHPVVAPHAPHAPIRARRGGAAPLALAFAFMGAGFAWSACATARSEPESATDHRARAAEERAAAEAARDPAAAEAAMPPPGARLDRAATLPGGAVGGPGADGAGSMGTVGGIGGAPTLAPPGDAAAHDARARRHENAAHKLEEAEDAACVGIAPAQRTACPIFDIAGVVDTPSGVRVTFASEAEAIKATQVIRCQQAFARTRGYDDVPACSLYARGLSLMQHGATIELTAERDEDVVRLRENVRGHKVAR